MNKVSLQTSLERNLSNLSYISILSVKFENLTVGLHVLIISFMLAKFQEDQRSIVMLSIKWLNYKFCDIKFCIKKKKSLLIE